MSAAITLEILLFIAFSIPIMGALWRLFLIRERLQADILENRHRLELLERGIDSMEDQQQMFLTGLRENLQHVRDRSKHEEEALELRINDIESYLEKNTPFSRRRSG